MTVFDDYLDKIENIDHRNKLTAIFQWIEGKYPRLEGALKWNQPMYLDHGTFIIGFSAAKKHFSVAPETKLMTVFENEIHEVGYEMTKGLFKIKWDQDISFDLLEKIIEYNIEDKKECSTFWRQ